jgi:molecular chaperone GrpE
MSPADSLQDDLRRMLQGVDFSGELAAQDKAHKDEVRRILVGFLEVLDALDRAASEPGASATLGAIQKLLVAACEQAGVHFFKSLGQPFDPRRHQAREVRAGKTATEVVVEEITRGCEWNGELLRPAGVVVARPAKGL